jgi:hypothetical protein
MLEAWCMPYMPDTWQVTPCIGYMGIYCFDIFADATNTYDTTRTGTLCHRSGILATIPVPVKPVGHLPWVYPYPCYTLPRIVV